MRTRRRFEVLACMLLASTLVMTSFAAKDRASDDPPGNSGGINPITHLPEPESFSERLYTVPDPFTSWEGTKVKPKEWDARAKQLHGALWRRRGASHRVQERRRGPTQD